jgi:hypothetical protein
MKAIIGRGRFGDNRQIGGGKSTEKSVGTREIMPANKTYTI